MPSAANGGVVTMDDVQRLIDQRLLQAEESMHREHASMRRQMDALEGSNAALKNQVEDLKLETRDLRRQIQVLKKDVKWKYSAPYIPRSHWIDQGHDDQYIAEMIKLLKQIRKVTKQLRNGEQISVIISADVDVPLTHDDALLPHWSELSDAMQICGEGDLLRFTLWGIQLNQSVIEMFSRSLTLKCPIINLVMNDFMNQDGVNFAVEVMRNNPQMKAFNFKNSIRNEEIASQLCQSIMKHPEVESLGLQECCNEGDTFGYTMLKTLLSSSTKSFVKLYFVGNQVRTNGCSILPDYIASNPPLTNLVLDDNHLVDDDLRMISIALKTNDRLKELYLEGNDYSSAGIKWLEVAVKGSRPIQTDAGDSFLDPNFDSVFGSNHTCRIFGIFGMVHGNWNLPNCWSTPLENKLWKLYDLFHWHTENGELVKELQRSMDENVIILMPLVLNRIESVYSRLLVDNKFLSPLSIRFDLIRRMPELLEKQR